VEKKKVIVEEFFSFIMAKNLYINEMKDSTSSH